MALIGAASIPWDDAQSEILAAQTVRMQIAAADFGGAA
jgi:hypothetical protein